MTATTGGKPRNRTPGPADLPEVAHNGGVPDSRGLVLAPDPDKDLAWTRGPQGKHSLVPVAGGYVSEEAPTTLRPCYLCGEPARPVQFMYATDLDYAMCGFPLDWGQGGSVVAACLERARKEREAVAALIAAPAVEAPAEPAAGANAQPAAKPAAKGTTAPRRPRTRASGKGPAKTAEAAPEAVTEPPEGGAA